VQQCKANCDLQGCLRAWYRTPLGGLLLQTEREQLDDILPELFGYHLLQLGGSCSTSLLEHSPIRHRVLLDADPTAPDCGLAVDSGALPIASDSVDVMVLHHALEFAKDPRHTLREVERVLIPEGVAIIVGFNPYSLWGLRTGWSCSDSTCCRAVAVSTAPRCSTAACSGASRFWMSGVDAGGSRWAVSTSWSRANARLL
jgi:SAM-dependent methyltransferase